MYLRKCILVLMVVAMPILCSAQAVELYVATNGNDAWSGALLEPNTTGTDGPLATIVGARDRLRVLRGEGKTDDGALVWVRGGTYPITEAIRFYPEDSGASKDFPDWKTIHFSAYKDEQPVISGGKQVTGFIEEDGRWVVTIPEVASGEWHFSSLWVNGERAQPARTPNAKNPWGDHPPDSDFFRTAGPVMVEDAKTGEKVKSSTAFKFHADDIGDWDSLDDAVVVTFHSWATSLARIKNIDRENNILEFTGPARWAYGRWQPDQRFFIEHLYEGLDQPGEWYLNKKTGKLYYIPREGETIEDAEVIAPVAQQLLVLEGKPEEGKFVQDLYFEGIDFQHTEYPIATEGHSDSQAAFKVHAAIEMVGARSVFIENASISLLGNYGVWFRRGSQYIRMSLCEITDLGAGGVRIGEGGNPASDNEVTGNIRIDNNFIHDGGRTFRSAVGVWIGRSSNNTITHNEICDFRYTGVSVGWSWGYAESSANHNVIEKNHIHNIGLGQLNDMGAIYCLGISPGTTLRGNLIHDVISHPELYGGWGLYTDEGSTGIVMENNLVYNTTTGGFHQHYGRDNIIRNNIFAYSHGPQVIRSREEEHNSFTFENNIVYFNTGQALGSTWKNGNWKLNKNIWWDTSGDEPEFSGRTFAEWQAQGHDVDSLIADPGFVNAEAGDFRLKDESVTSKIGFKPFRFKEAGLYGDPEWFVKPKAKKRPPFTPPPIPQPREIHDNFEGTLVHTVAAGAATNGEEGNARIRVTTEKARVGKHALKFSDAPELSKAYNPHLVYAPHIKRGVAHARFSVYLEPGAVLYHEWRDSASPYNVGPSLWLNADGKLTANGKEVTTLKPGQWMDFKIVCPLGETDTHKVISKNT